MFLSFLHKSKLEVSSKKKKWFVMGNEASDLDSIICSLVYSFYKQKTLGDNFAVIPVCCMSKSQLFLKKDVHKWLDKFHIDAINNLVFFEDIVDLLQNSYPNNDIQVTLVDHHKPQVKIVIDHIREVIDHREIVYHYPKGQLSINNMELVGSCSTLVASYILDKSDIPDRDIMLSMLRGVILLDTECLKKSNGKTTEKDVCTIEAIEMVLGLSADSRSDIYNLLSQAKADISDFTLVMMVNRDLKILEFQWSKAILKMCIPTMISIDVEDLLATVDLEIQLGDILENLNANIIIALTCGNGVHKRRGYLIYSNYPELNDKIQEYLLLSEQGFQLLPVSNKVNMKCLYQNNLLFSRKTFIPIIEEFFKMNNQIQEEIKNSNQSAFHKMLNLTTTCDADIVIEIDEVLENEGAPYTLNTPLRSYSGSPDNRSNDMSLPSLNNRYTLQLVDKKRQKHHAEIDAEITVDDDMEFDKPNNDDKSPLAYTPENSDDESETDSSDVGPLPLLKHSFTGDKIENKRTKISEQSSYEPISKSETSLFNDDTTRTVCLGDRKSQNSNLSKDNINDAEFNLLAEKVDQKRQKLQSSHVDAIANSLVNEIMKRSRDILSYEIDFETLLNDWSQYYTDEEKKEIYKCINANNFTKLADLLASSLIRDCVNIPNDAPVNTEIVEENAIVNNEICPTDDYSLPKHDSDYIDSFGSLEAIISNLENNYDNCHLGNMINKENQCLHSSSVNFSSADVVENISFNLYRRISSNQLDYSEEEKELLTTAGDWLPKREVIYSDTEQDEHTESCHSGNDDDIINEISEKDNFSTTNISGKSTTNSY